MTPCDVWHEQSVKTVQQSCFYYALQTMSEIAYVKCGVTIIVMSIEFTVWRGYFIVLFISVGLSQMTSYDLWPWCTLFPNSPISPCHILKF